MTSSENDMTKTSNDLSTGPHILRMQANHHPILSPNHIAPQIPPRKRGQIQVNIHHGHIRTTKHGLVQHLKPIIPRRALTNRWD